MDQSGNRADSGFRSPETGRAPSGGWRRKLGRWCKVLALPVAVAAAFFYWPRSMPEYIRLPAGHSNVQVKSWLSLWDGRHYYVKTSVPRALADVVDELAAEASAKVLDFTDYPRPAADDPESFQAWLTAMQIADTLDQVDRYRRAQAGARPRNKHGGYGEPLPDSFVIVTMEGPNRTASHFHNLRYRLTPLGEHETLVEVWDYKRFDT